MKVIRFYRGIGLKVRVKKWLCYREVQMERKEEESFTLHVMSHCCRCGNESLNSGVSLLSCLVLFDPITSSKQFLPFIYGVIFTKILQS